jgi:hypothetical protein
MTTENEADRWLEGHRETVEMVEAMLKMAFIAGSVAGYERGRNDAMESFDRIIGKPKEEQK